MRWGLDKSRGIHLPGRAYTCVVISAVHASCAVHTRRVCTVLVVGLAVYARITDGTRTSVRIDILFASGSVGTGLRQAFVDVHLAVTAGETVRAHTRVVADTVQTRGSVLARRYRNRQKTCCIRGDSGGTDISRPFYILTRSALVCVDHAVTALESGSASALV